MRAKIFITILLSLAFLSYQTTDLFISDDNIPVKMELNSLNDDGVDMVECIPVDFTGVSLAMSGSISGEVTYLGTIDPTLSTYEITLCHYGPSSNFVTASLNGRLVNDEGEFFVFYSERTINTVNGDFTGTMDIVNGSGAFQGIKGELKTEGKIKFKSGKTTWTAEGNLEYTDI